MTKQDQAVQAQAELTDEQITEIYRSEFNGAPNAAREAPRNVPPLVISFARAIEREVRSAASSTVRESLDIASLRDSYEQSQGAADSASTAAAEPPAYMTSDKRMLIFADSVTEEGKASMIPLGRLAGPSSDDARSAAREQARIAELEAQLAECSALSQKWAAAAGDADGRAEQARNEALEEAAKLVDKFVCEQLDLERMVCGRDISAAIRALKAEAPAASKEGDAA